MKKVSKPLKAAAAALLFVGALSICPNFSQAQEAKQILKGLFDLIDQAQKSKHPGPNRNNDQPASDKLEDPSVDRNGSTYSVGGMRLGERTTLKNTFNCKPSDQFKGYNWCSNRAFQSSDRGKYQQGTSLLLRQRDDVVSYVNRELSPAFFAPNEIQDDIDQLTSSFKSQPKILTMPQRPGLPSGAIATWGDVSLEPLDEASLKILADGESPKKGILADFLNDLTTSAKERLPVYRLAGSAGYVWIATHDKNGRGKLRFFAVDASALTGQSSLVADRPPSQTVDQANTDSTTSNSSRAEANDDAAGAPQAQQSEAKRSADSAKIDEENRATAERAAQSAPAEWKQNYSRGPQQSADISTNAASTSAVYGSELEQSVAAAARKIRQEADDAASLRRQQFELEQARWRQKMEGDTERRRKLGERTASPADMRRFDDEQRDSINRFLAQREQNWQAAEDSLSRQTDRRIADEEARIRQEAAEKVRSEQERKQREIAEQEARERQIEASRTQEAQRVREADERAQREQAEALPIARDIESASEEKAKRAANFQKAVAEAVVKGREYAAKRESDWTLTRQHDAFREKDIIKVTSTQINSAGLKANVVAECADKQGISFTATIVNGYGKAVELQPGISELVAPLVPSEMRNIDEDPRLVSMVRLNAGITVQVALASVSYDPRIVDFEFWDRELELRKELETNSDMAFANHVRSGALTWRILAEIDTIPTSLVIKLPLFERRIRELAISCGAKPLDDELALPATPDESGIFSKLSWPWH